MEDGGCGEWKEPSQDRQADRWRNTEPLAGPSAAGPSHLALVSAPPTPAQTLQFKGHHRGGPYSYPHLIWPDPGLQLNRATAVSAASNSCTGRHATNLPFHGLCTGFLGATWSLFIREHS